MKTFFIFLTIALALFVSTIPVEAHFLAIDKHIGAVLHVDPNDEPIVGSQTSFFFEFKDKENKFISQNCNCTFIISENGKDIFSQPLFQNNTNPALTNASVFYTFPQKDVYVVTIVGKPLSPNAFQPFTLTWNFRVDQRVNQKGKVVDSFSPYVIYFLTIGIFLIVVLIYYVCRKGSGKEHEGKNSSNRY